MNTKLCNLHAWLWHWKSTYFLQKGQGIGLTILGIAKYFRQ